MKECSSVNNQWWVSLIGIFAAATLCGGIAIADGILTTIMGNRTEVAHKVATFRDPGTLSVTFSADSAKVATADILHDTLRVWTWRQGNSTSHSLTMRGDGG